MNKKAKMKWIKIEDRLQEKKIQEAHEWPQPNLLQEKFSQFDMLT